MKVLIFGGTGLLGSQIAFRLQTHGETVRCVNRKISPNLTVDQYLGDIFQPNSYRDLVSSWEPNIVIQCAWITSLDVARLVVSKESPLFKYGWRPQDDLASRLPWALSR